MRRLAYRGLTLANAPACWFKRTCPQVEMGLSPKTGSASRPAALYDLYRHTFLKDCGSHDKKTPARGMEREPDPAPGDGREGVISGHLGVGPWGGLFQLRSMVISFRGGT